jgi:DNA-directed RNA polymerase subunit RPC12/RpoP
MPTLSVVCHRCGHEFPSSVSITEDGIGGQLMDGIIYECPHCRIRDPYFTVEHRLPGSGDPTAARSSSPYWSGGAHARVAKLWWVLPVLLGLASVLALAHSIHIGWIGTVLRET